MTNQETKELIHKLIVHYKKSIIMTSKAKSMESVRMLLSIVGADVGVCRVLQWYSVEILTENESLKEEWQWIRKFYIKREFGSVSFDLESWGDFPFYAETIPQAIDLLQIRLNNLITALLDQTYVI